MVNQYVMLIVFSIAFLSNLMTILEYKKRSYHKWFSTANSRAWDAASKRTREALFVSSLRAYNEENRFYRFVKMFVRIWVALMSLYVFSYQIINLVS